MSERAAPRLHVALLSAEFPPVGGGGVIRPLKLVKYLPRLGWQVTVLCSDERLANAYDDSLLEEIPPEVRIVRSGPALSTAGGALARGARERFGRSSPPIRLLRRIRGALRSVWAIPDHRLPWALSVGRGSDALGNPDAIVSTGPPHSTHIGAALLARRLKRPLILDFRDEWVLNPFYAARVPGRLRLEAMLERWCIRRSSRAVFVSDVSRERYVRAFPGRAKHFHVIPNGYDPDDFIGLDVTRRPAGDVVRIGYAGSLDHRRDGAPLFRAVGRRIRAAGTTDVALTMIGPISPEQRQLAEAEVSGAHLEIRPFLPHREALAAMTACDVLLVVTNVEEAGPAALTGKIFEYLAMRRPILVVAPPSAATKLVDETNAGVWADPTNAVALDEALEAAVRLARDPSFSGIDEAELRVYDRSRQAEAWDELLRDVIGSRTSSAG